MRTRAPRVLLAAIALLLATSGIARASLITTDAAYTGPSLQLGGFANGNYNFTFGPVLLPGGITFTRDHNTSNSGLGAVLGQGSYGLGANGSFDGNPVYAGYDGANGHMDFRLASPVSQLGFFLNYAPGTGVDPLIEALDIAGNPFETWDLATAAPISTPGGLDQFLFRGITETSATIYGLRLSNSYILATGTANGAPVPGEPTVPEPTSLVLLGSGLVALARKVAKRA